MNTGTPKILVVDDEPDNRFIIEEYLEDEGYELQMAEDGAIAWKILQDESTQFDTILLDIMMPNMNGLEVLELIKAHDRLRDIPVILQTAKGSTDDIARGIQAGAFYYLTKPFSEDVLISIVRTAIRDRQRYKELQVELGKGHQTFGMMKSGTFQFRSLDEGKVVIHLLAQACPEPKMAILGLSELLINAVEHGNLGIDYNLKSQLLSNKTWEEEVGKRLSMEEYMTRFVEVEFNRSDESISFKITDQGEGFDWEPYMQLDARRGTDNHGRGIAMANMLSFDHIEYLGKGNEVIATINL